MNAVACGEYMVNRMKQHGRGEDIIMLKYKDAGHFVDPPYMPKTLLQYNPAYERCMAVGGTVDALSDASVHCWEQTLLFLEKNCGEVKAKL